HARLHGLRVHLRVVTLRSLLAVSAAALLVLAEEPRQLRGEALAGRQVDLGAELVGPLLELLDVRRGLVVVGDGLRHLLAVGLDRRLELRRVDGGAEERPQALAERQRGAWT